MTYHFILLASAGLHTVQGLAQDLPIAFIVQVGPGSFQSARIRDTMYGPSKHNRLILKTALLMPVVFYGMIYMGDIYEMYIHG
jgi:hypothetical protein